MREQNLSITTPDGTAPAELYTPDGAGPWPGIVYLTDVWGIRPASQKMARRVAEQGYAVLLPHLFYRNQPINFDPFLKGQPRDRDFLQGLLATMTPAAMTGDGVAYAKFLIQRPDVAKGGIAVIGYCFSGAMAVRTAAALPGDVVAAASFHGGGLVTEKPDSPHTLLPKIKSELYFGHAVEDASATPQQIAQLDDALKGWGGAYQSEIYEGAHHGWTVEGRPEVYNPVQSERHYEKLFDLLKRNLK